MILRKTSSSSWNNRFSSNIPEYSVYTDPHLRYYRKSNFFKRNERSRSEMNFRQLMNDVSKKINMNCSARELKCYFGILRKKIKTLWKECGIPKNQQELFLKKYLLKFSSINLLKLLNEIKFLENEKTKRKKIVKIYQKREEKLNLLKSLVNAYENEEFGLTKKVINKVKSLVNNIIYDTSILLDLYNSCNLNNYLNLRVDKDLSFLNNSKLYKKINNTSYVIKAKSRMRIKSAKRKKRRIIVKKKRRKIFVIKPKIRKKDVVFVQCVFRRNLTVYYTNIVKDLIKVVQGQIRRNLIMKKFKLQTPNNQDREGLCKKEVRKVKRKTKSNNLLESNNLQVNFFDYKKKKEKWNEKKKNLKKKLDEFERRNREQEKILKEKKKMLLKFQKQEKEIEIVRKQNDLLLKLQKENEKKTKELEKRLKRNSIKEKLVVFEQIQKEKRIKKKKIISAKGFRKREIFQVISPRSLVSEKRKVKTPNPCRKKNLKLLNEKKKSIKKKKHKKTSKIEFKTPKRIDLKIEKTPKKEITTPKRIVDLKIDSEHIPKVDELFFEENVIVTPVKSPIIKPLNLEDSKIEVNDTLNTPHKKMKEKIKPLNIEKRKFDINSIPPLVRSISSECFNSITANVFQKADSIEEEFIDILAKKSAFSSL